MTDEQFKEKQAAMSNAELIEKVTQQIHALAESGGRSHRMCVPPQVNDTDMLLCEMVRRFEILSEPPHSGARSAEEILIETFDDYGNFGSLDDVFDAFKENRGYSKDLLLHAMTTYAAEQVRAATEAKDWEINDLKLAILWLTAPPEYAEQVGAATEAKERDVATWIGECKIYSKMHENAKAELDRLNDSLTVAIRRIAELEAEVQVGKIMSALNEANEIHSGRKKGQSFDDFLKK